MRGAQVATLDVLHQVIVFATLVGKVLVLAYTRGKAGTEVVAVVLGLIIVCYAPQEGVKIIFYFDAGFMVSERKVPVKLRRIATDHSLRKRRQTFFTF